VNESYGVQFLLGGMIAALSAEKLMKRSSAPEKAMPAMETLTRLLSRAAQVLLIIVPEFPKTAATQRESLAQPPAPAQATTIIAQPPAPAPTPAGGLNLAPTLAPTSFISRWERH